MHHPITTLMAIFEWFPLWGWNHLTSKASNMKEKSVRWCPEARAVRVSCHGNMCVYRLSRMVTPCNVVEAPHSSIDWVEKFLDGIAWGSMGFNDTCHTETSGFEAGWKVPPGLGQCGIIRGSFSSELMGGRTCNDYVSFSLQIYTKAECNVP